MVKCLTEKLTREPKSEFRVYSGLNVDIGNIKLTRHQFW